jgi:hypothetical protein
MATRSERYERARAIYAGRDNDLADDKTFARSVQAATVMWLFDCGEDTAAEKLLDLVDPPSEVA